MRKSNLLVSFLITLSLSVLFFIIGFTGFFTNLDYRVYDTLYKFKKEIPKNEKILLVEIDDPSIHAFGEWPWSRDVIADALLRMKELGARLAVFDIEYISPSKAGVSPSAEEKISTSINTTKEGISQLIQQLTDAMTRGYYKNSELPSLTKEMLDGYVTPSFEDLDDYIASNIYRDNDEYFGQCIQFFENAYLTVNNKNLGYTVTKEEIDYIKERMLLKNVEDKNNKIKADNNYTTQEHRDELEIGFQPALATLIKRARGVGFTNSYVDGDGTRRRFELLYEYDGQYLAQLVFSPLIDYLDVESITRTRNAVILNGALFPDSDKRENLKIPVDSHGRMLLNMRHGMLNESFNNESFINIITMDTIEKSIINILKQIEADKVLGADGFEMEYTEYARYLIDEYDTINMTKEILLSRCTGYDIDGNAYDGITQAEYDAYFSLRAKYFADVFDFIELNFEDKIYERLDQIAKLEGDDYLEVVEMYKNYIEEDFTTLKDEYYLLKEYKEELAPKFNGALCILGNTAASTTDTGATPFIRKYENVGLHANFMNTVLNKDFIYQFSWLHGFALAVIIALIQLIFVNKSQAFQNVLGAVLIITLTVLYSILFTAFSIYIPFVCTVVFFLLNYMTNVVMRFVISNREKRLITAIASSFANKETVEQLRKNPELFDTKGQKKVITALFSDVQKFSTLSENVSKQYGEEGPNKLIEILNEYLGSMSNEILNNQGTIDKYEGDAIISMFGAPDSLNLHTKEEWAYYSLDSAIKMKKAEVKFNEDHPELFKPIEVTNSDGEKEIIQLKPLQTRIGINTGDAYVGLMGSKTETFSKLNYTMMGDTVNLASRLEGVNKAYGSWIMCSQDTWEMANSGINKDKIAARKLDRVRVIGKNLPVQLYNIIGFKNELTEPQIKMLKKFDEAMELYFERKFSEAGKLFVEANKMCADETSLIYATRCKEFIEKGVPEKWDGVINMTSK